MIYHENHKQMNVDKFRWRDDEILREGATHFCHDII